LIQSHIGKLKELETQLHETVDKLKSTESQPELYAIIRRLLLDMAQLKAYIEAIKQMLFHLYNSEQPTYIVNDNNSTITCFVCGRTSHNSNDVKHLFCAHCDIYHNNIETSYLLLGIDKHTKDK
jgi:hypothetical protein